MFMVENKAPSFPSYDQSIQKFNCKYFYFCRHLNPVIIVLYITMSTKYVFIALSVGIIEMLQRVLCHPIILWIATNENTGSKFSTFIYIIQTFFLGFIRSHCWQLVLHCVRCCHVTSDTVGKDLAWCHLRSLWLGQINSNLEKKKKKKKKNHFRKLLRRETSGCDISCLEVFGRAF